MSELPMSAEPTPPPVTNPGTTPPRRRSGLRLLIVFVAAAGAVGWAILEVRDRARPALAMIRGLRSSDPASRRTAAEGLTRLNAEDTPLAAPALAQALGDPDTATNLAILRGLSEAGLSFANDPARRAEAVSTTAAIAPALSDDRAPIRAEAARIMAQFAGLKVEEAGPVYDAPATAQTLAHAALTDPADLVRYEASQALILTSRRAAIDPPAELAATLGQTDKPGIVRSVAAALLGGFPQGRSTSFPILMAALGDGDPLVRRGAAVGLAAFPADQLEPALASLTKVMAEPAPAPAAERPPIAAVLYASKSHYLFVINPAKPRGDAGMLLGTAGESAYNADAERDATYDPAIAAAQAVAVIASGATTDETATKALAAMLAPTQPAQRRQAAAVLLNLLGRKAVAAAPALVAALQDALPDPQSPLFAPVIDAVGKTAPRTPVAAEAVAALDKALVSPSQDAVFWASLAIGSFGAEGAPALPTLRPLANSPNSLILHNAQRSIAAIENPRPPRNRRPGAGPGPGPGPAPEQGAEPRPTPGPGPRVGPGL